MSQTLRRPSLSQGSSVRSEVLPLAGSTSSVTLSGSFISAVGPCDLKLPAGVCAYQCRFDTNNFDDTLFETLQIEQPAAIANSIAKRRAEFLAGRYVARLAMSGLGAPQLTLGIGVHRNPVWPTALVGSIAHSQGRAVCAVARAVQHAGLGIDLQNWIPTSIAQAISALVLNPQENALLSKLFLPFEQALTLAFSAKESLFKALYPMVGRYFDFRAAELRHVSRDHGEFELVLRENLNHHLVAGALYPGHVVIERECVFTSVVVPR